MSTRSIPECSFLDWDSSEANYSDASSSSYLVLKTAAFSVSLANSFLTVSI